MDIANIKTEENGGQKVPKKVSKVSKNRQKRGIPVGEVRLGTYSCNICKVDFSLKKYYKDHITIVEDGKKLLKCCACDKKLSYDVRILEKHIAFVHEGKQIKCSFCNDYFAKKEELDEHEASVHKGRKPTFDCIICNSNFPLKSILNTHMETVHEDIQSIAQKQVYDREGPNSCHICQISFHQKQYYRTHVTSIQDGKKCFR